jgi:DMSO/TMAO reductase YedYZ molybdopterin-dependent catalytic subunit
MKKPKNKTSHLLNSERGLHELYSEDYERADHLVFGRESNVTRRGFLKGLGSMGAVLGFPVVFSNLMPSGLIPIALADSTNNFSLAAYGKQGLRILNDRPINAETPPHLLNDSVTPAKYMFVRNNGIVPSRAELTPDKWTLTIDGESVINPRIFTIDELKKEFKHYTYQLQLECGGNGRAEYVPPARGNQWTTGAIACPTWTGVRVRDVLKSVGIRSNAVYTAYYGKDKHLSGNPKKFPISRGVPIAKAMEDESMIVWAMNGKEINILNGHPLRVVTGGWPGSTCGKWINRIAVRDRVHDGAKMTGKAYKVPKKPVAPGEKVKNEDMMIIESMPVKSLITFPRTGIRHPIGKPLATNGHAWAGDLGVSAVEVSIDFGSTWNKTRLLKPKNRLSWQDWSANVFFPKTGYYEVWSRAIDENNVAQPMLVPGWNPKGYLNNRCHRIAVNVV